MSSLSVISKVIIPIQSIDYIYNQFREAGLHGMECVALWAGIIEQDTFRVKNTIIPKQFGYRTEDGLLYSVEGDELYRINVWLYQNQMTLIGQIHSHPGDAYHSETDDRFPIVATVGGLSVVIPNFAADKFSISDWAVFRLSSSKEWNQLSIKEVNSFFQIEN